jgi:hypothetical protein
MSSQLKERFGLAEAFFLTSLSLATFDAGAEGSRTVYRPPRLVDGRPNLQGNWDHLDPTPLERPAGFDSLVISKADAARIEASLDAFFEDRTTPTEPTEFFNERHILPIRGELRSSIIVEPQDGKLPWKPALKNWSAETRRAGIASADGPEQRPNSERCLGNPASQPPNLNNPGTNLHQIVQTADTVVFVSEWGNAARIIRLNSHHAPAAVTSWLGDSIGWWEGDTLVVESKNFSLTGTARMAAPNAFKVSARSTVIERFALVSNDELNYQFTVDDPESYTQPWKGETHFMRTRDQLLEYACHEDNRAIVSILQAARIRDGQWPPVSR